MVVDITSPDVHGLEHFDGGEAKVVGHAGGQTVLDFGYGKTELFPSACCVACPWRTRDNEDEDSDDDDDASLSGDETASLGEEEIFAEKSSPPALPIAGCAVAAVSTAGCTTRAVVSDAPRVRAACVGTTVFGATRVGTARVANFGPRDCLVRIAAARRH